MIDTTLIFVLIVIIIALLVNIKKREKRDRLNQNLENRVTQHMQELEKIKFTYLFNNTIEGIIVFEEGKCIDINDAGLELFQFDSKEEAFNTQIMSLVADDSKEIVMEHLKMQTTTPYEVNAVKKNGVIFPILVAGKDVTISNQSFRVSYIIDLSLLKKKERELEITTEYLNRFYNNNGIGILLVDKNRIVKKINTKLARLWGYKTDELIGKSAQTFHISSESYKKFGKIAFEQALNKHKIDIEYQFKRKDGSLFWAKFSGENINADDVLWIITDINELKKKEADLILAKEKAEESTKLKSEFLANMSHEIRTPMNGIIGMSYLALKTSLDKKQKNYLLNIEESAKNLLNIINDILDFSKIEAGKLSIEKINFNMKELLESIKNIVDEKVSKKDLTLSIEHSCSADHICFGDKLRITQVLLNLVGNAIKFTSKGFIKIHAIRVNDKRVRFEVKDTGIGISQEQQNKIFQSFSQADGSTTRKYGGTGLGLSISKQLVELMHGKIWVESELNVGSKFIFEIELHKGDSSKIELVEKIDFNIQNLQGSNILLVDDNRLNQEIIIGLLENSGINIEIANNGKEAIDMFIKNDYELILMDLQMPIMGGIEATKIIRESNTTLPIIALTANAMKKDVEETQKIGMNEHLSKPIEVEKLYRVLVKYIPRKINLSTTTREEDVATEEEISFPLFQYIDTDIGLSHMANNKNLYLKILHDFYSNYRDLELDKLNDNALQRETHTIKGLSASIGAMQLNSVAQKLEESLDKAFLKEFHKQLDNVLNELKDLQESAKTENLLTLDTLQREALFKTLKEYAQKRRSRECRNILEDFKRYSLSQKDKELLDKINEYLCKRDYKRLLTTIAKRA